VTGSLRIARRRLLGSVSVALVGIALCIVACGGDESPEPRVQAPQPVPVEQVSIRFPIPIVEAGQAPFYVAEDLGYYKAENVSVRFEMGSKELNPVKTVATGQDTIGLLGGPDTLLVARSKGVPLKAIAVFHRDSNFPCLLTLKSSGITKVEELEGKKVGFYYGHISTDVLRNLFRKSKVKVTEVDVGFDYSQLISGGVSAQWAFTVTAGIDLPAKGVEVTTISPATYGIVTHGYTLFASEETLSKRGAAVRGFLRATLRGLEYCLDHPEEANRTLVRRDSTIDEKLSLTRLKAYNAVTSRGEKTPLGYLDLQMFRDAYDRLKEEGVIEKPIDPSSAFTTEVLDSVRAVPAQK